MNKDSYREEVLAIKASLDEIYDESKNQQELLHGDNYSIK